MPRITRSSVPLPGIKKHGATGYRNGCGCFTCRRGRADEQARSDARRKARADQHASEVSAATEAALAEGGGGAQEKLTRAEIDALGTLSAEAASIANLAMLNAKLIDTISAEGRWHLLSATVRTLRELMKELRGLTHHTGSGGGKAEGAGEDDDDDFAGSLRRFG